jgi:hypothetical protein
LNQFSWKKPVICFFKERKVTPEKDPFAVVKAHELIVSQVQDGKLIGQIKDFFSLMGDVDYIATDEGASDNYVLCWFDDIEPDQTKDLRRLRGVTFPSKVSYTLTDSGKRTYNADFQAERGKLK